MKVVKMVITQHDPDPETVKLLTTIYARAMTILAESPSLFAFVKRFKKNCSEEFLKTMLTSCLMSLIMDKFPWKTDVLKEKGALASLLCDMLLEKEDFAVIRERESGGGEELPYRLKQHPLEIAEALRKNRNLVPSETLTIIELHHELPDGKGFQGELPPPGLIILPASFSLNALAKSFSRKTSILRSGWRSLKDFKRSLTSKASRNPWPRSFPWSQVKHSRLTDTPFRKNFE